MAILIVIMVVVFVLAMYLGWWTLKQEEEHEGTHEQGRLEQQLESSGSYYGVSIFE